MRFFYLRPISFFSVSLVHKNPLQCVTRRYRFMYKDCELANSIAYMLHRAIRLH